MRQRAHIKSGGSSASKIVVLDEPIKASLDQDVLAFRIGSCKSTGGQTLLYEYYNIMLRISGTSVQLVAKDPYTDEVVGTAVNLVTNLAQTYSVDFTILKIHYINKNLVIIKYQYPTSATAKSAITIRPVTFNGVESAFSLILGTALAISAVTSATVDVEGYLLKGLFGDFLSLRKAVTISSGAYNLLAYPCYANFNTPAITAGNAVVNVSSNANTHLPSLSRCACTKGIFYRNASDAVYVNMLYNYQSNKNITRANFCSTLRETGDDESYIIGFSIAGGMVLANFPYSSYEDWHFYIGSLEVNTGWFMLTAGTGIHNTNRFIRSGKSKNLSILSFSNNVILYSDGSRQKLLEKRTGDGKFEYELLDLEAIPVEHKKVLPEINPFYNLSPESDLFNGVFAYC